MTLIFKLFFAIFLLASLPTFADDTYKVYRVDYKGLNRTSLVWLSAYTGLNCPCELSSDALDAIKTKLVTTQVFQNVSMRLVASEESPGAHTLEIEVDEKWTLIPVIRGAFGGGTPLFVAGIYDTHAFGSLWTLGAESRTYGTAPAGGVVWIRAPRWQEGFHYLNFEVWRDNRIRSVYDRKDRERGRIYGSSTAAIAEALMPIGKGLRNPWQAGLRLQFRQQHSLDWQGRESAPDNELFDLRVRNQKRLLARLVYDDMAVLQQNLQGLRILLNAGPTWSGKSNRASVEQELFWYGLWNTDWNLTFHQWLGLSDDRSYQGLFFLGGFDSVRGLPDGVMYGNKAVYGNLELRKIFLHSRFVRWQAAAYVDSGAAGYAIRDWAKEARTSWGFGLRLAVPQVNRLVFRVDYAWSLSQPKTSSISIGMNQFIDPYRPL